MSIVDGIITKTLIQLEENVNKDIINYIREILVIELNNYDITEKCTDIILDKNSNLKLLKRYVADKRLCGLSENSIKRYVDQDIKLMNFINKPLDDISTDDIRVYLSTIKIERNLSNVSIDGIRRCISSLFMWLTTEELIDKNPCLSLRQIKHEKKVKKPFTEEEITTIKKSCVTKRDKALVEFLYSTGCRVSEIVNLNVNDINFKTKECIVHGKGNKERYVYLSDNCLIKLNNYIKSSEFNLHTAALFQGKGTDRLSKNGIEQVIKKLGEENGICAYPHKFRRTCATYLLNHNMEIQDVSKILGHENLNTTMIYLYLDQSSIKNKYMEIANKTI